MTPANRHVDTSASLLAILATPGLDLEDVRVQLAEVLRQAFNEVSAAAWRDALETFAGEFERGLKGAHAAGMKPQECGVEVTDVIMIARALAAEPKQVPAPPSGRAKEAP